MVVENSPQVRLPSIPKSNRISLIGEASYANTTSGGATLTSAALTSQTCDRPCFFGEPGKAVLFDWPVLHFIPQVLATVIVQINTLLDVTATTTKYGTVTSASGLYTTGYVTDITDFWNSELGTTGVIVQDGTPTFTYKPTIYTAPDKYITITTVL